MFYDAVEDSSQLSPDEDEDHMSPFNSNTDLNNVRRKLTSINKRRANLRNKKVFQSSTSFYPSLLSPFISIFLSLHVLFFSSFLTAHHSVNSMSFNHFINCYHSSVNPLKFFRYEFHCLNHNNHISLPHIIS